MIVGLCQVRAVSVDVVPELCRQLGQAFVQQHSPGLLREICLIRVEDRREIVVFSEWASPQAYELWRNSNTFDHLVARTSTLLEFELRFAVYEVT
jgi:quinol monooxygenase YgiN